MQAASLEGCSRTPPMLARVGLRSSLALRGRNGIVRPANWRDFVGLYHLSYNSSVSSDDEEPPPAVTHEAAEKKKLSEEQRIEEIANHVIVPEWLRKKLQERNLLPK